MVALKRRTKAPSLIHSFYAPRHTQSFTVMMMDNAQEKVVAVGLFFAATTWVTTVLRIYVRAVMIKNVGLEDYLAVLALVSDKSLRVVFHKHHIGLRNILGTFYRISDICSEGHIYLRRQAPH